MNTVKAKDPALTPGATPIGGAEGGGGRAGSAAALFFFSVAGRPQALAVELQNNGMRDQPINGRHRRHRVFENLVPFGEHQIAAEHARYAVRSVRPGT